MQHGLGDSSDQWFLNGEDQSIGFFMVQNGFDVWVSNNRGNKYCKGHIDPKISKYDFYYNASFQDYGLGDIPAFYETILSAYGNSQTQKIIYLAHSQGTSQMFVSLLDDSTKEFVTKHTEHFFAFAPIVFMTHCGHMIPFGTPLTSVLAAFTYGLDIYWLGDTCCDGNGCGFSIKSVAHYGQLINGKNGYLREPTFRKYNYSEKENLEKYGVKDAPEWDLSEFPKGVGLSLQVNKEDFLANEANVDELRKRLDGIDGFNYEYDVVPDWEHNSIFDVRDKTVIFNIIKRDLKFD